MYTVHLPYSVDYGYSLPAMAATLSVDTLPVIEPRPFKGTEWRQDKSLPNYYIQQRQRSNVRLALDRALRRETEASNQEVERQAADYRRSMNQVTCPKTSLTSASAQRHSSHPRTKACWNIMQAPLGAASGDSAADSSGLEGGGGGKLHTAL